MCGRVDASTQQKLDMALDDLVERKGSRGAGSDEEPERNGRRRSDYGPSRDYSRRSPHSDRHSDRSGPYSYHDGRSKGGYGKGKGRRRMPLEDKAMLNTQCFINPAGDLVVRLYDTEVFVLKKQPAHAPIAVAVNQESKEADAPGKPAEEAAPVAPPAAAGEAAEAQQSTAPRDPRLPAEGSGEKPAEQPAERSEEKPEEKPEGRPEEQSADKAEAKPEAKPEEEKPAEGTEQAVQATDADSKPAPETTDEVARTQAEHPKSEMVVVLTSGTFRTAETRFVINEALRAVSLKVVENSDSSSQWTVSGEVVSQRFEDGMELPVKVPVERASDVQRHMAEKIQDAKAKDAQRSTSGNMQRSDYRDHGAAGPPPMMPPGDRWGPPGMGPPPPHLAGPPRPAWHYGTPPGWPGIPPPGWRGPPVAWGGPPPPWALGPGAPRHPGAAYGGDFGGKGGSPAQRGPLPDSCFQ
mmetsp:Transcript_107868/g.287186  ORF Transcript_107868/g.287186 Transcript_107868/m.287186 type:complete len:466 (-) Transcript_107868:30-1427(-)|eukprot:CAMPEP_0171176180 /NCGR_PEP_ID=MMETSP0790-20130122/11603_1 /TAXON_ID=2925 /ORGANISM="Alexandrium catenella, Strain OF101" /LENGTH=465 /DNA_ID=CAMNT_0011641063 /DNA_START=112 /DNA_END=1509 /DNA_ORIENTATION=-